MALDFPNAPVVGQRYPAPPIAGQPVYQWDGAVWQAAGTSLSQLPTDNLMYGIKNGTWQRAVALTGDNMTGPLSVMLPTAPEHAIPKSYADQAIRTDIVQGFTPPELTRAVGNIGVYSRYTMNDTNLTLSKDTRYLALVTTLTAPRTLTLPPANSLLGGFEVLIADEAGVINATNTLTIAVPPPAFAREDDAEPRAASDQINGSTSPVVLSGQFSWIRLRTDGQARWTIVGKSP